MIRRFHSSARAYLGGLALGVGILGLLFVGVIGLPMSIFGAHFFGGLGFHEGPQPTPAQLDEAVSGVFWWSVWHRLVPFFIISVSLIGYGFYEAHKEKMSKA